MIYGMLYKKDNQESSDNRVISNCRMGFGNYTQLDNELSEYRSNNQTNSNLDRIIKGCIQLEANKRPSASAILDFLNNVCDGFEYERELIVNDEIKWCKEI
uniref:Protein kinase domain-containing protein n=1 Tax=Meloidogyne hapla TaxID=6305 RepID=A0A1I8AY23_MELHA